MSGRGVSVAQIGCGYWGRNLARNFTELGALVAVADASAEVAADVSQATGVPVRSIEEILGDPAIQAVALASPASTHADLAVRSISAGKHVFVEKPLALTPREGQSVVEAAERHGRVLMVGHLLHYHPLYLELKRRVSEGDLGQVRYVYSNRLSLGKIRTEENVLWSFAPHDISMILGLIDEAPRRVTAQGAAILDPKIADWSMCELQFALGPRAHVHTSWMHPFKEQRLVVVGESGMAVFEDSKPEWEKRLALYRHTVDLSGTVPIPVKAEPEYIRLPRSEPLRDECSHFLDCVATGARPRTDGQEGLRVLEVLNSAEDALSDSLCPRP